MQAARAGYIAGFAGTSNVKAAAIYDIPAFGTMAHSFVQAFGNETDAFNAYLDEFHDSTTLLVDTYDTTEGIAKAIRAAKSLGNRGATINAIRIDSGNLAELAIVARSMLDDAGLFDVKIMVTGGLDETQHPRSWSKQARQSTRSESVRDSAPQRMRLISTRFTN